MCTDQSHGQSDSWCNDFVILSAVPIVHILRPTSRPAGGAEAICHGQPAEPPQKEEREPRRLSPGRVTIYLPSAAVRTKGPPCPFLSLKMPPSSPPLPCPLSFLRPLRPQHHSHSLRSRRTRTSMYRPRLPPRSSSPSVPLLRRAWRGWSGFHP